MLEVKIDQLAIGMGLNVHWCIFLDHNQFKGTYSDLAEVAGQSHRETYREYLNRLTLFFWQD